MWLEIELSESGQKTIQKAGKASSVFLSPRLQGTSSVFPAPHENFDLLRWKEFNYVYAP
jgi:hypothetical protein